MAEAKIIWDGFDDYGYGKYGLNPHLVVDGDAELDEGEHGHVHQDRLHQQRRLEPLAEPEHDPEKIIKLTKTINKSIKSSATPPESVCQEERQADVQGEPLVQGVSRGSEVNRGDRLNSLDCSKSRRTVKSHWGLFEVTEDCSKSLRIVRSHWRLFVVTEDCSKSLRIVWGHLQGVFFTGHMKNFRVWENVIILMDFELVTWFSGPVLNIQEKS